MKIRTYLFIIFVVFFCFSCSVQPHSTLSISCEQKDFSLIACNNTALSNKISNPTESSYIYYGFSSSFLKTLTNKAREFLPAIEVTVAINDVASKKDLSGFALGFLYENDYSNGKLKSQLDSRPMIYGFPNSKDLDSNLFRVSFAVEPKQLSNIRGFVIYSEQYLEIENANLVPAKTGWAFESTIPWFGFSSVGGNLPKDKNFAQSTMWNFETEMKYNLTEKPSFEISVSNPLLPYQTSTKENNSIIKLELAKKEIEIYPRPTSYKVTLNTLQFENPISYIELTANKNFVDGIVLGPLAPATENLSHKDLLKLQNEQILHKMKPIVADPGLIRFWPQSKWRHTDFELFSWEYFPSILIFDFADYKIQDDFLKRLAFFVEKSGYVGTLMTDEEIANQHGYNAHDYKAESLASFFDTAQKQNFQLNQSELLLRHILLENGIIKSEGNRIIPGNGAIISLSKQSANYLRNSFLCHEGMHGVFFIDEDYRIYINELFNSTDKNSVEFLKAYFTATPTLNYDINDDYLLKNEFMGYLVQQGVSFTSNYFANNLATRKGVNEKFPELCRYIKKTKAQGFVEAAMSLDEYLYNRWGMQTGREWTVYIN